MKDADILVLIDKMIADATEWSINEDTSDGYWRGVCYMVSSVLEHFNGES